MDTILEEDAEERGFNKAWSSLFHLLGIKQELESHGIFRLKAATIKDLVNKEPRNMVKWDSGDSRPKILQDQNVTILPISRSEYVLLKGSGYHPLPKAAAASYHSPHKIRSYTTLGWEKAVTKESLAIDVAALSSMLGTFTGEKGLALTIRGRSGTSEFSFNFKGEKGIHLIQVNRAQIEIDAGFEGDSVWLVEAKIGEPEDFLIRQLFYPWRQWKTQTTKEVIPVFLCYANRAFGLFKYSFENANDYHSIKLLDEKWLTLDEPEGIESLELLFSQTVPGEPGIRIFPQADILGTVISAVELCARDPLKVDQVSAYLGYDPRQGGYYTTAAEWVSLLERRGHTRKLTGKGQQFVRANKTERFKILFRSLSQTPIFREFIEKKIRGSRFEASDIAEAIRRNGYGNQTTANRRSQTLLTWLDWLWREYANLKSTA